MTLRCTAGPDAGREHLLRTGRQWIGRGAVDIGIDDPTLEAHHAVVDVSLAASVSVLQIAGRSPLRVDGFAADGWVSARPGSIVEVGCSRLEIVEPGAVRHGADHGAAGAIHAPLDGSDDEAHRFERDLARVAPALRRAHLDDRRAGSVEVGVASIVLAPLVLDRSGLPVPSEAWSDRTVAAVERHARHELPLRVPLSAGHPIAVVGPHRDAIIASMVGQFGPTRSASVLVLDPAEVDAFDAVDRPIIIGCETIDDVPRRCTATLDIGSTWRGTWHPDPGEVVRLHAAARRVGAEPSGPLVAEQVARAGAEARRGVVGIPQAARGQRQAAASDAAVELVAEPNRQGRSSLSR